MQNDSFISIVYTFTLEEARAVIYGTGRLRPYKKRSLFQTALALAAIIYFTIDIINHSSDIFAYVMVILGIMLVVSSQVMPKRIERDYMQEYGMLEQRTFMFNEKAVTLQRSGGSITIPLRSIANYGTIDDTIIVASGEGGSIAELPTRAASDEQLKQLDEMINAANKQ